MQRSRSRAMSRGAPRETFDCTVRGTTAISAAFQRVHLHGPGLLQAMGSHPTMWARFWFRKDDRTHQRAFTVINVQPAEGTFDIDVYLHGGSTSAWAKMATPGLRIQSALQGTGFAPLRARTSHMHLIGDAASIPAIRTILEAFPMIPATLWLEQLRDGETAVPLALRPSDDLVRVLRDDGTALTRAVISGLAVRQAEQGLEDEWFWIACEATANRALLVQLRDEFDVPRSRVSAMAYWKAT
ncbi:MAG: siderophore-interacting protein [Arachnia sp.]